MTKENLYNVFENNISCNVEKAKEALNKFFNSNVVIPKCENRHPYADVLHEWIEGAEIVASEDKKHNHDVSSAKSKLSGNYYLKKCIKPSEPVYEYLWMDLRTPNTYDCPTGKYMTVDEASLYFRQSKTCFRVKETKRVRQ